MRVMSVRAKPIIAESYRHHGHQKRREIPFTRERSKVRSLVRPPFASMKSDFAFALHRDRRMSRQTANRISSNVPVQREQRQCSQHN